MLAQINPLYYVLLMGLLALVFGRSKKDRASGAAIIVFGLWLLSGSA